MIKSKDFLFKKLFLFKFIIVIRGRVLSNEWSERLPRLCTGWSSASAVHLSPPECALTPWADNTTLKVKMVYDFRQRFATVIHLPR